MTRVQSNTCRYLLPAAGRASGLNSYPPALRSMAHLFIASERVFRAIFGSPVVRARAAGLAITNTVIRLLNHSGASVICDTHPRLYRSGGRGCGVQIRSEPQSRHELPGKSRADRSNRLKAVRVVLFVFVAALLHAHNKSMEKQACRTQNLGSSNP